MREPSVCAIKQLRETDRGTDLECVRSLGAGGGGGVGGLSGGVLQRGSLSPGEGPEGESEQGWGGVGEEGQ